MDTSFQHVRCCFVAACALATCLTPTSTAHAQESAATLIPRDAPNCRATEPPAAAGLVVAPGGFIVVYPRNDALTDRYSGCKILWIADTDRTPRVATLVFQNGALVRAIAHNVRDPAGAVEGACAFPEGKSLMPNAGQRFTDAVCRGFPGESLYALKLASYPMSCMKKPDAAECAGDPK